jgi:hypothetical protein
MLSNESAGNAYWLAYRQTFVIALEMMPGSEPLALAMLSGTGNALWQRQCSLAAAVNQA